MTKWVVYCGCGFKEKFSSYRKARDARKTHAGIGHQKVKVRRENLVEKWKQRNRETVLEGVEAGD